MSSRALLCIAALPLVACGFGAGGSEVPAPSQQQGGSAGAPAVVGGSANQPSQAGSGPSPQAGAPTQQGGVGGGGGAGGSSAGSPAAGASPGGSAGASSSGSGGGGSGGSEPASPFKLLWRDDFDSFDDARWVKATHTFDENAARFVEANAVVEGGLLKLKVTNQASGNKQYSAAEVLSTQDFTFGRFEGRIKFCAGSGMVSSLFTYKENVEVSWQEIDVEHLGNLPMSIQYNLVSGTLANRQYQPRVVHFAWSPTADFHDYAIEWLPGGEVTFYVDGVQSHTVTQQSIVDAAKLRMNAWPTNNQFTSFAGPLDTSAIPCEAQYDWVQVFSYEP